MAGHTPRPAHPLELTPRGHAQADSSRARTGLDWQGWRAGLLALWAVLAAAAWPGPGFGAQQPPKKAFDSITVVSDDNYPPYIFRNDEGRLQGILVDQWALWEKATGIRVNLLATGWDKAQQVMAQGGADVIDTMFKTAEREKLYDFTKPYATLDVPVFFHKDIGGITDAASLRGFSVGVKTGDAGIEVLHKAGVTAFHEFENYKDVLEAAKRLDIRVFLVDKPPALYYIYKLGLAGEYRLGFNLYSGQFHRAVKKGRAELLKTVEDGFAALPAAKLEAIEKKWLGAPLVSPLFGRYLFGVLAAALGVAAILGAFNLTLRGRVRAKTKELATLLTELRTSEEHFRSLLARLPIPVFMSAEDGRVVYVNDRFVATFGYTLEDIPTVGHWMVRAYPDEHYRADRIDAWASAREAAAKDGGDLGPLESTITGKNGLVREVEISGARIGEMDMILLADITERKHAEDILREQQEYFRKLIQAAPLSMGVVDLRARTLRINAKFVELLGWASEEVATVDAWWEKAYPDPVLRRGGMNRWDKALADAEKSGAVMTALEAKVTAKDGAVKALEFHAARLGDIVIVMLVDLTTRKNMQEILIQTEKMTTVAGLAAGMAHEINNPLGGILQSAQVAMRRLDPDVPANLRAAAECGCSLEAILAYMRKRDIPAMLEGVRESAMRASQIVLSMLELSRKDESVGAFADVNALLDKAVELSSTDYDLKKKYDFRHIAIQRRYDPDLPRVYCSAVQIQQVVMNLLRNAAQAMAENPKPNGAPAITLTTRKVGERVRIEVGDNGPGMEESVRRKVFEPFFTTKSPGNGTGLGLSVSYFIITNSHRGRFVVDSTPGQGTTFCIELPIDRR